MLVGYYRIKCTIIDKNGNTPTFLVGDHVITLDEFCTRKYLPKQAKLIL